MIFLSVKISSAENCRNPSESQLNSKLASAYLNQIQSESEFLKSIKGKSDSEVESFLNVSEGGYSISSTHCTRTYTSRLHVNSRSVCPFTFKKVNRFSKFPFNKLTVECKCDKCSGSDKLKQCVPVRVQEPYLIRGQCVNGTYEFNQVAFESVPKACVCLKTKSI